MLQFEFQTGTRAGAAGIAGVGIDTGAIFRGRILQIGRAVTDPTERAGDRHADTNGAGSIASQGLWGKKPPIESRELDPRQVGLEPPGRGRQSRKSEKARAKLGGNQRGALYRFPISHSLLQKSIWRNCQFVIRMRRWRALWKAKLMECKTLTLRAGDFMM